MSVLGMVFDLWSRLGERVLDALTRSDVVRLPLDADAG